jgi:hypothetical protein
MQTFKEIQRLQLLLSGCGVGTSRLQHVSAKGASDSSTPTSDTL